MQRMIAIGLAAVFACGAGLASAAQPLVDAAWAKANLGKPGIVFLDATSDPAAYAKGHVPGAVATHYKKDNWRIDKKVGSGKMDKVSGLLPPAGHMEKLIGGLGIGNADHVVVIVKGAGAADMGSATRIYWTFKVLGHENVSILNGGMKAYLKDKKNPLDKGAAQKPAAKTFTAKINMAYMATQADLRTAVKNGGHILDNRPRDQFLGVNKSGAVTRYGKVPGAVHVPGAWLTEDGGNMFRDAKTLRTLYKLSGAPTKGETITYCNTGHWASLGWFANSEILGNKKTKMYDASMSEWSRTPANPMQSAVPHK